MICRWTRTDEIERCQEFSFFVTHGGAAENLGLISALYALREAIPRAASQLQGKRFPTIHLILIEASALSYDYEQDRGAGAGMGGGKERLAGGLAQTLIRDGSFRSRNTTSDGGQGLRGVEDWICGRDGKIARKPDMQVEEWGQNDR
jgi:hypothetical protein